MKHCKNCATRVKNDKALFCPQCGQRLEVEQPAAQAPPPVAPHGEAGSALPPVENIPAVGKENVEREPLPQPIPVREAAPVGEEPPLPASPVEPAAAPWQEPPAQQAAPAAEEQPLETKIPPMEPLHWEKADTQTAQTPAQQADPAAEGEPMTAIEEPPPSEWPQSPMEKPAGPLSWDTAAPAGQPEAQTPEMKPAPAPEPLPWEMQPPVQQAVQPPMEESAEPGQLPLGTAAPDVQPETPAPEFEPAAPAAPLPWEAQPPARPPVEEPTSPELLSREPDVAAAQPEPPAPVEPLPWEMESPGQPPVEEPTAPEPLSREPDVAAAQPEPPTPVEPLPWEMQPPLQQAVQPPMEGPVEPGQLPLGTAAPDVQPEAPAPVEPLPWEMQPPLQQAVQPPMEEPAEPGQLPLGTAAPDVQPEAPAPVEPLPWEMQPPAQQPPQPYPGADAPGAATWQQPSPAASPQGYAQPMAEAVPPPGGATKSKRKSRLPILIGLILLVVGGVAAVFVLSLTAPQRFIQGLSTAIAAQDTAALRQRIQVEAGLQMDDTALVRLCNDLRDPEVWPEFQRELLDQMAGGEPRPRFDAIEVRTSALFSLPGFDVLPDYALSLKPVTFSVETGVPDSVVEIASGAASVEQGENGAWTVTAAPGRYEVRGAIDVTYSEAEASVTSELYLSATEEPTLALELPVFPIEIACGAPEATISINGVATGLQPEDDVVTVPYAEKGMTIQADWGTRTATLVVTDREADYAFNFGAQEPDGVQPGEIFDDDELESSDIDRGEAKLVEDLLVYYLSYLECINNQVFDGLRNVTEDFLPDAQENILRNLEYRFDFTGLVVDQDTIDYRAERSRQAVDFYVRFEYEYWDRNGGAAREGSSIQYCTLLYDEDSGNWQVDSADIDNSVVIGPNQLVVGVR